MADDDHIHSLIPLPNTSPTIARPKVGRVLSEMVKDTLALARRETLFKIGEYEWCEPDYQQILRWAETLALEPEEVIRRLLDRRSLRYEDRDVNPVAYRTFEETVFQQGKLLKLNWDFDLLPCVDFQWVDGLKIEYFRLVAEHPPFPADWQEPLQRFDSDLNAAAVIERAFRARARRTLPSRFSTIRLSLPTLRTLICSCLLLDELDLSHLPCLESLDCSWNRLSNLCLHGVPKLRKLNCSENNIKEIYGLGRVPELLSLNCSGNLLTDIGFYDDQELGNLEHLDCTGNDIERIDIRPLRNLKSLFGLAQEGYGGRSYSCRIVQRPDQHF